MSTSVTEWGVRELEARVLDGSGLGSVPGWGNGSGAERIRHAAAERAGKTIGWLHGQGAKIAPPDTALLAYIAAAAAFLDKEEWDLSRTWQVTSDVARAHIDMGHADTDARRQRAFDACVKNMDEYYGLVPVHRARGLQVEARYCGPDDFPYGALHGRLGYRKAPGVVCGIVQRVETPPGGGPFPTVHELIGRALMGRLKKGER